MIKCALLLLNEEPDLHPGERWDGNPGDPGVLYTAVTWTVDHVVLDVKFCKVSARDLDYVLG